MSHSPALEDIADLRAHERERVLTASSSARLAKPTTRTD